MAAGPESRHQNGKITDEQGGLESWSRNREGMGNGFALGVSCLGPNFSFIICPKSYCVNKKKKKLIVLRRELNEHSAKQM